MTLACTGLAVLCWLCLVFLDETYPYVRPWLAAAGLMAGVSGVVFL